MAQHEKLIGLMQPMERFARAVNSASDTARSTGTSPSGSVYIPNGDGTGTLIGVAAGVDETGAPQGRVDFVNDTTPPSMPTGVSYSTGDGRIHAFWDGTLTDGVPADFAHVEFYAGEAFMGRLVKAGSLTWEAVTGTAYRCTACAVDVQGNESEATEAVEVTVTDTVAEVNADVAEVKEKAAALETELDTTNQKVTQVASDVDGVKTSVTNAVEKAEESLTVATSAQQTATEVKTTADKAYSDAESALTQASEAKQTASELSTKVTEAVDTANSAKTTASTAQQTADTLKQTVEANYLTKDEAGTTYTTKTDFEQTAESIKLSVEEAQETGESAQSSADTANAAAAEAANAAAANSASIELLTNSIKSLVTDANGNSLMEQTADGWRWSTADVMSSIDRNASKITTVEGSVTDLSGNVTALSNNVAQLLPALDYMSYSNGVLELGKTGNPFKVQITNERIAFVQDGAVIAYLSNNQLYISAAIVTDELQMGDTGSHYIWKYRQNAHLGLRYYSSASTASA